MKYSLENKFFRFKNKLESKNILVYIFMIAIVIFTVYPFIMLIGNSFGFSVHGFNFTLDAYKKCFQNKDVLCATKNTIYVAFSITILSGVLGISLAFLVNKTNIFFKKIIKTLIYITFIIPSYIMSVAWIEILGHNGYLTKILLKYFGVSNSFQIYSLEGVIIVMSLHLYPLVFMTVSNALKNIDGSFEKSAFLCGAGKKKVFFTIILPMIMPSILSILLFVFSRSISCFGVAAVLGLPVRKYILTTYIYSFLSFGDLKFSAALSTMLLISSGLLFFLSNLYLKRRQYSYKVVSQPNLNTYSLGRGRSHLSFLVLIFLFITAVIPIVAILGAAFLKKWGIELKLSNLTFNNFKYILFEEEMSIRAIKNSILYGFIAATASSILGMIISYISMRTRFKFRKLMEFSSSLTMASPETIIAIAAIFAWANKPFELYNTKWIIIVTYIVVCIPFVIKNINGLMSRIDKSLENASKVSGASFITTFKKVIIPSIAPGIMTGFILSMIFALREIPVSVLLYSRGCETVGVLLFNLRSDTGGLEVVSAVALVVIILILIGQFTIEKFGIAKRS